MSAGRAPLRVPAASCRAVCSTASGITSRERPTDEGSNRALQRLPCTDVTLAWNLRPACLPDGPLRGIRPHSRCIASPGHSAGSTPVSIERAGTSFATTGQSRRSYPLAQEAVTVARATYGPENPQVRLSLNEFGLLLKDQEKFAGGSLRPHRLLRPRLYPHRKYKSFIYNTWTPSHCAP